MGSKISVEGVVRDVRMVMEEDTFGLPNVVNTAIKPFEIMSEFFLDYKSRRGYQRPRDKQVWTFILEITDEFPHDYPFMIVEMTGGKSRGGGIRAGDSVIVTGKFNTKNNVLYAKYLQSTESGAVIRFTRF